MRVPANLLKLARDYNVEDKLGMGCKAFPVHLEKQES